MKKKNAEKFEKEAYERLLKTQSDRIEELRKENAELNAAVSSFHAREKEIADALTFAKQKGEEYVSLIRVKYALECDRIRKYREKLEKYRSREELIRGYDDAFRELRAWQDELENALIEGAGEEMRDYEREKERLKDEPQLRYGEIAEREKTNLMTAEKISEEELKELLEQL